jgi:hypothetical protein
MKNRFLQDHIQFEMVCAASGGRLGRALSNPAWAIYNWLQDCGHVERWVSCDGFKVSGVIRAETFSRVLPKLHRYAFKLEFYSVGR